MQLRTDAILLSIDLLQTLQIALRAPDDERYQQQACQCHQEKVQSYTTQFAEHIRVIQRVDEQPVCLAAHRSIEDVHLMAMLILQFDIAVLVAVVSQVFEYDLQQLVVITCQQIVLSGYEETLRRFIDLTLADFVIKPAQ